MAFTNQKAWYISTNKYAALSSWVHSHGYSVGDIIRLAPTSVQPTIAIGASATVTWKDENGNTTNHNLQSGDSVIFSNSGGAPPTGITVGTQYYVISAGLTATAFEFSATVGGSAVTTSGSNTGTTTVTVIRGLQERCFLCTVAGTSGTTEPTWTITRGAVNSDNTVTWQEVTGVAGINGDIGNTPVWLVGTSYSLGHVAKSVDGTKILMVSVAGTSHATTEPTWSSTDGTEVTDNGTLKWRTLKHASAQFAVFAAPHNNMQAATANNWGGTVGATPTCFFLGSSHAYTHFPGTAYTFNNNAVGLAATPVFVACIGETSFSGSNTPTAADLTTGAVEATGTGTSTLSVTGSANAGDMWVYGVTFRCGTTSGNTSLRPNAGNAFAYFENCRFELTGNVATAGILYSFSGITTTVHKDCTFKFANAAQGFVWGYNQEFINCTLDGAGTIPTTLFGCANGGGLTHFHGNIKCIGCDWSSQSGTLCTYPDNINGTFLAQDCKLHASVTLFSTGTATANDGAINTGIVSKSGTDGKQVRIATQDTLGGVSQELTAVRTGGGSINSDKFSLKFTTTSNMVTGGFQKRAQTPRLGVYNSTTAANVTATIYGIINAAAVPTDQEVHAALDYLGTAAVNKSTRATNRPVPYSAAANLTADSTSAWDGVASARQNTHAYSLGDMISLASNPGRLFFCTTAGTSTSPEPGGYASAVDGGSVTDGSAVFRAGCRFKIAFTLDNGTYAQPQIAGEMFFTVYGQKASTSWYIDPLPVLT